VNGLTRWLAERQAARISGGLDRRLSVRDDALVDLAGNDYLGLSTHPDVVEAAVRATREYKPTLPSSPSDRPPWSSPPATTPTSAP
jgi:7-keto-8-aminopelargonate synthetase-like enzyme